MDEITDQAIQEFQQWLQLGFNNTVSTHRPKTADGRMLGHIQPPQTSLHVEAIPVERDHGGIQRALDPNAERTFSSFCDAAQPDGGFKTVEFDGQEFAVFTYPFSS